MALLKLTGGGRVEWLLDPGGPGRSGTGRLGAARTDGPFSGLTEAAVAWVLVEGGRGRLRAGSCDIEVAGRGDVFERAGWSAIVGPATPFELVGELRATIVWRATRRPTPTRVIDPASVPEEARGEGATQRRVRTYVPEGELIVGETLNPAGGWSSYPPHRHDHEELYLYRFEPASGFGVHVSYDEAGDAARVVRDGSIERITAGYHPVVAAPAAVMYYLWALAGDADTVDTRFDPRYVVS